ncbi:chloride channel protein [Edaphobacter aggregans]|uniref:chloride channel protein n=1 Tax=Edaphobacter aggregans TaxID=570835 RepID=UPI0009FF47CC|nr:chloride channel protein [Edaphobacter aggregans]
MSETAKNELRDYTTADARMVLMSCIAVIIGGAGAVLSWALLRLIFLATNLFYFHRVSAQFADPAFSHLGWRVLFLPVIGGLLVGLIARYGSDRIRGHGMPEAIEAVLMRGARISPKITVIKPVATAIAIGSGGPFGAEGPIIMTGGAAGSLLAQLMKVSDAERSTLLVAGAAAGMAATFLAPLSAILLAVELLLFEWRPRSLVPVAVASVTAAALRRLLLGSNPVFPMSATTAAIPDSAMLGAVFAGLLAGLLALLLTRGVHFFEEMFEKLPIHWMWWPAIGGVLIGLGGWVYPPALGVGYATIQRMLNGDTAWTLVFGVLIVKSLIWTSSLGSGTSGGILAPQLMIGGGLGVALAHVLPGISPGAWPLICMAAVLAGSIGTPLTASVLAVELTHNSGLLLPLLLASVTSYGMDVLLQHRSILTERLSRRGYHLSREYGVDPLETVTAREVMHTSVFALPADATRKAAADWLKKMNQRGNEAWSHWQRLFPLVDATGRLNGVLTRGQMILAAEASDKNAPLLQDGITTPAVIGQLETLRSVAEKMAALKIWSFPVEEQGRLVGILNIEDLLEPRGKASLRDKERQRVLTLRWPFGRQQGMEPSVDALVDRAFDSAERARMLRQKAGRAD